MELTCSNNPQAKWKPLQPKTKRPDRTEFVTNQLEPRERESITEKRVCSLEQPTDDRDTFHIKSGKRLKGERASYKSRFWNGDMTDKPKVVDGRIVSDLWHSSTNSSQAKPLSKQRERIKSSGSGFPGPAKEQNGPAIKTFTPITDKKNPVNRSTQSETRIRKSITQYLPIFIATVESIRERNKTK
jgi:hypothetical protein